MTSQAPSLLATTDGSADSLRVLPHAAAFARAAALRLLLLRVVPPAEARSRENLLRELEEALMAAGAQGEPRLEAGDRLRVPEVVMRVAAATGAGLLAMTTRGHSLLHHLHGSAAMEVLARGGLPVMLTGVAAAAQPAAGEPYRLLVTSDGSAASARVLPALAPLLARGRFQVTLLRVHEMEPRGEGEEAAVRACFEQLEGLRTLLPAGLAVETKVREIPRLAGVDSAILEEAERLGAAAIAISTHGHTAARHLIMGSTALAVLSRAPLPLIMVRALG